MFKKLPQIRSTLFLATLYSTVPTVHAWQPAAILNSHEKVVYSSHTDKNYLIQVATIGKRPANGYPVIYVLDGNAFFGVASSIAQMNHDKPSEKNPKSLMVVGIGYTTGRAFDRPNRTHDYTPPSKSYPAPEGEQTAFGGADYFHAFIADELAPMLDREFGINPNHRTLIGHSYGGLFGLYLLMAYSKSFDNYVIASPSIWWNNKSILVHKSTLVATPNIKNILITLGEHELNARHHNPNAPTVTLANSDAYMMSEFLKNKLPHANITFYFNPNHSHGENAYPSIIQGINMAYQACKADTNC